MNKYERIDKTILKTLQMIYRLTNSRHKYTEMFTYTFIEYLNSRYEYCTINDDTFRVVEFKIGLFGILCVINSEKTSRNEYIYTHDLGDIDFVVQKNTIEISQ